MKRSILRALALCLATAFVPGIAWAQADENKSINSGAPPGTSAVGLGTQSGSLSTSASSSQAFRLSRLMNTSLRSQTGENLGQVQDIVLDPASGQVQFVVLQLNSSATGAPGTTSARAGVGATTDSSVSNPRPAPSTVGSYGTSSGQLVAVPWRLVTRGSGDQFTTTVDRTRLQSAPTFSSMTWPTMDSTWMQRVYSHFGTTPPASTGAPGSSSGIGIGRDTGTGIGTGTGTGTGTGLGNPATPGLPSTPGTPDINPPGTPPSPTTPGTGTGTGPGGTGTGGGTGK